MLCPLETTTQGITELVVLPEGPTPATSLTKAHNGSSNPRILLTARHIVAEKPLLFWCWLVSSW